MGSLSPQFMHFHATFCFPCVSLKRVRMEEMEGLQRFVKKIEININQPAMGVYNSVWNGDDWGTQCGNVKTDWTHAPFISSYKEFEVDACECPIATASIDYEKKYSATEGKYWWDEPLMSELGIHQNH